MPELPEVETVRSQLEKVLKGKVVKEVEVLREKSFRGQEKNLIGGRIVRVERKAKLLCLLTRKNCLLVHLKMTGQLVWVEKGGKRVAGGHPSSDWVNELPSKHTRVIISFGRGKLYFNDMRVFGWMNLIKKSEWEELKKKMPVDVIDRGFTKNYFKEVLEGSKRAVKLVIMDQKKIGGVGNIYANDGLFLAGIKPEREAKSLSNNEVKKLWSSLRKVVNEGLKLGGATASDEKFVDVYGMGGEYQKKFKVYGREGERCCHCGKKIKKVKLGGRGTYFCGNCQS